MSEYQQNGYIPNNMNQEIGWDDTISKDSEFVLLPEGDYKFTVTKFERARHNGSDKLPPCNKAVLTLELTDGFQNGIMQHNLFLHRKCEGMLCAFFTAIGQRKHGEALTPRWDQVIGATGTCKIGVRKWKGNDGSERESNEIRKFYEKDSQPAAPSYQPTQQPAYQQPPASYQQPIQQTGYQQQMYNQQQNAGYTPGNF